MPVVKDMIPCGSASLGLEIPGSGNRSRKRLQQKQMM